MSGNDRTDQLVQQVRDAAASGTALRILGGDSKAFYGRNPQGEPLRMSNHRGILSYEPSELVITARAGTPLAEIETLLAEHKQMLPFEAPRFATASTLELDHAFSRMLRLPAVTS